MARDKAYNDLLKEAEAMAEALRYRVNNPNIAHLHIQKDGSTLTNEEQALARFEAWKKEQDEN